MTQTRGKAGRDSQPEADRLTPEERRNLQRDIDENLRRSYKEVLEEDVPDRFHQLLAALRDKDRTT
jgi:hypothetical protein